MKKKKSKAAPAKKEQVSTSLPVRCFVGKSKRKDSCYSTGSGLVVVDAIILPVRLFRQAYREILSYSKVIPDAAH